MNSKNNTWDLSILALSDDDEQLHINREKNKKLIRQFSDKWQHDTSYLSDTNQLKLALDEYEHIMASHGYNGWESYYFSLRSAQDQIDPTLKGLARAADEEATKLYNELQFFSLSIAKIPVDQQAKFLSHSSLNRYHHFLRRLFARQKFVLSEPEEKILNLVSLPAHESWVSMTSTFLSKEEFATTHEDGSVTVAPFADALSAINSQDKHTRDHAAQFVHQTMAKYADTATEELNAILQFKKTTDDLRSFTRPDMQRHLSDDIEAEVVDSLIAAVSERYQTAHDYYQLKAKLFAVEKLSYHERNVPYGNAELEYNFENAAQLVKRTLSEMDEEFGSIFTRFLKNGQFDVYPRSGKVGGAFCAHNLLNQPTYILLNHTNKFQDVLTLAHEVGHGIHNELARKNQHALYFGTSMATAEVASTFMEDFVIEQLLLKADKQTQLEVVMMKLNDDISSIFRQVACYQFEQSLHREFRKKGYLSSQEIGALFQEYMSAYMGPAVEQTEGSQNWWVYWSHIRNFFYVYSYASGLLISKSLQHLVRQDHQNIVKIKQFMAAGQSDSPRNIFLNTGIDIRQKSFWQKGLSETDALLGRAHKLANELHIMTS